MKESILSILSKKYQKEIWKNIPGFEGLYQASNLGRIKSLPKTWSTIRSFVRTSERILKPTIFKNGYYRVSLSYDNTKKLYSVHRLVALAFIPNVYNKPQVNHKDKNKLNNCLTNLEWVNASENKNHSSNNKYTGVSFEQRYNKWRCRLFVLGTNLHLGYFKTRKQAALVYKNSRIKYGISDKYVKTI